MAKDQVKVDIVGDSTSLKNATADAERSLNKLGGSVNNLGGTVKNLALGLGSLFAVKQGAQFFMDAANAAALDAQEQTNLANTLKNTTDATTSSIAANEAWISSIQNATGVVDTDLRAALNVLVIATEDLAEAQTLAQVAMDISVSRGLDLETVSIALAKAHEGNTTALGKMGLQIKDNEGNMLSFTDIVAQANEVFGGATQAAAETTAGKLKILNVQFDELKEQIGVAVMPVMVGFVGYLANSVIPTIQNVISNVGLLPNMFLQGIDTLANSVIGMVEQAINAMIALANLAISAADKLAGPFVNFPEIGKVKAGTIPRLNLGSNLNQTSGLAFAGASAGMLGGGATGRDISIGGAAGAAVSGDRAVSEGGGGGGGGGKKGKTAEQLAEEQRKKDAEAIKKTLEMWADARIAKREIEDNMYEDGKISRDKYVAIIEQRLTEEKEFTDEWATEKAKLTRILKDEDDQRTRDAKDAAEEQKEIARDLLDTLRELREKQDNMYEVGAISAGEYISILQGRLAELEQYSDEWTSVYKELQSLTAGTGQSVDTRTGNMVTSSMGSPFNIQNVNVTANNADELVASLNEYARRNGGLRVPGGVTAVS